MSRGSSFTNRDLTSIGIKTWMSISSLQNCGMYSCAKPNVEVNNNKWAEWAFVLRRWRPHGEERHAAYYYASRRGLTYCVALSAVLNFDYLGEC